MTINAPFGTIIAGYDLGMHPPCIREPESAYFVIHNMLIAHAQIYHLYEKEFKGLQLRENWY